MNALAPTIEHPLWWALVNICGLKSRHIQRQARLSSVTARRLSLGHNASPETVTRLSKLIRTTLDQIEVQSPAKNKLPPHIRIFKQAAYDACNHIIDSFKPVPKPPRRTHLAQQLLDITPTTGDRKSHIIAQLQRDHRPYAIRRAAKTVGITERIVHGVARWFGPPGPRSPTPVLTPSFGQPNTRRQEQVRRLVERIFIKRGDLAWIDSKEIFAYLRDNAPDRPFSKPLIYKTFRDMLLIKEATGFGATKRVRYSIPRIREPEPLKEIITTQTQPSKRIIVDFTHTYDEPITITSKATK